MRTRTVSRTAPRDVSRIVPRRVRVRNESSNAAPFVQLLVGAANKSLSVLGNGANATSLALQPGGGGAWVPGSVVIQQATATISARRTMALNSIPGETIPAAVTLLA